MQDIGNRTLREKIWFGLTFAAIWLAFGVILAFFWWPGFFRPKSEWLIVILLGPPFYVLGEWLIPKLWIDDSDDGTSETLATIKRVWRFLFAVAGTGAFFALLYFGIPWLATKI